MVYFQRIVVASNIFIFTLAISDLIFVLLCIPTTYITAYLMSYWPFSEFACIFLNFMQSVSVTITVYTLVCITMDKYWALCNPLKLRISRKWSKFLILANVVFALIVSLPIGMYTQLMYFEEYIESGNDSSNRTSVRVRAGRFFSYHQAAGNELNLINLLPPLAVSEWNFQYN